MSRILLHLSFRFLLMTAAMTTVLALLQYLRLGQLLIEASAAATSLLSAAPLAGPALMTVTLPTGLLIAGLMTCREHALSHEWLAMRLCGVGLGRIAVTLGAFGVTVAALTGACAFWLAPLGLEKLGETLQEVYLEGRLVHSRGAPIQIDGGLSVAVEAAKHDGDAMVLTKPWIIHANSEGAVLMRAQSGVLTANRLTLTEVRTLTKRVRTTQQLETIQNVVEIELGKEAWQGLDLQRARWSRQIPALERASSATLWRVSRDGDPSKSPISPARARGALYKRLALTLAPPGLILLSFPLSQPARIEQRDSAGRRGRLFVAFGVCGMYYAMLRLGEVLLRDGGDAVWVLALPCGLLGIALAVTWRDLWRRW